MQCMDEESKALSQITCPRPLSKSAVKFRFKLRQRSSGACALTTQDEGRDQGSALMLWPGHPGRGAEQAPSVEVSRGGLLGKEGWSGAFGRWLWSEQ